MREQSLLELQSLFHTFNHWHSTVQSSANNHIILTNLSSYYPLQNPTTKMRWRKKQQYFITTSPSTSTKAHTCMFLHTVKILCCCSCSCAAGEWGHKVSWVASVELDRGRVNWTQDMCRRVKQVRLIGAHTQALNANLWQIGPYHHILPCYSYGT